MISMYTEKNNWKAEQNGEIRMFEKSKNKNLLIIGAGGHGKVIADIAECMGCYETIVFADADESLKECMGYPVFREEELEDAFYEQHDVFVVCHACQHVRQSICHTHHGYEP